jgi:hypothetical protein
MNRGICCDRTRATQPAPGIPNKAVNRIKGEALSNRDSSVCALFPSETIAVCRPTHRLTQCIEAADFVVERSFQSRTSMVKALRPMWSGEVMANRLGPDKRGLSQSVPVAPSLWVLQGWEFPDHPSQQSRLWLNLNPHPMKRKACGAPAIETSPAKLVRSSN